MSDIDSVDATIRMFQPDIELAELRPKPLPIRHAATHGEISRAIYDALRGTGEALTTQDVTLRVMAARSLNIADVLFVRTMQKRVGAALRQMREKGRVQSARLVGGKMGWKLPNAE